MSSTETTERPSTALPDPAAMMAGFWSRWMEQSTRGTQALLDMMQTAGDPRHIQRRWVDAVARSLEDFMRTPAFLEVLKSNLKAMTDLKELQNQVVQDIARQVGMPLNADITGLFERLHSTEKTILARLQSIEDRIQSLASKH
jgi:hypothetical protein